MCFRVEIKKLIFRKISAFFQIDQLCDQVGIESVLLLSENGSDIQVGSERGKQFLVEKGDIEAQFLTFCLHGMAIVVIGTATNPSPSLHIPV